MAEGTVIWFEPTKGYGYIRPDDGGPDVFVHYSSIQTMSYRTLDAGEWVSFDIVQGTKGPQAINVSPLGPRRDDPPAAPASARWWIGVVILVLVVVVVAAVLVKFARP